MNTLTFNSVAIRDRQDMLCLTDMWKAAGSPKEKSPADWRALGHVAEFIEHIADVTGLAGDKLLRVKRGRNAETWAHWQPGLAYAKYLSHEFHAQANTWIKERMEAEAAAASDPWRLAREQGKETRVHFCKALAQHGAKGPDFPRATDAANIQILGMPASRFKEVRGLPKSASTRDHVDRVTLMQLGLAEALAVERIEQERLWGGDECVNATAMAARSVVRAVTDDRANRRPAIESRGAP